MGKASESFRKVFSEAMDKRGAVADLCRKTGISRTAVERWLASDGLPNIDSLEKIADALETTPAALVGGHVPPEKEHGLPECCRRVTEAALSSLEYRTKID